MTMSISPSLSSSSSQSLASYNKYSSGDAIERIIDNQYFNAKIISVDNKSKQVKIQYSDDGNIEDGIPYDEIRLLSKDDDDTSNNSSVVSNFVSIFNVKDTFFKKETLLKPLAGLIDDDHAMRLNHKPSVVVHQSVETEEAIVINGAENKLAAGGGLRALRYLAQRK